MNARADRVLVIDQGTSSTRAAVFDASLEPVAFAQEPLAQHYPRPGWVEHDPEEIWRAVLATGRAALAQAGADQRIAAIGITNQRETTLLWDRSTGQPIHPAIVWQDRRTTDACEALHQSGAGAEVHARTGLVIDPYFSASKVAWLLGNVAGARAAAERGALAFGTVDSFLLARLTGGLRHATDATNACRTMLFNLDRQDWDEELLRLFGVPRALLPEVLDSVAPFGVAERQWFGVSAPVLGMAGDQQAATVGQACLSPGQMKATFGTGCFALLNTGSAPATSRHRLLTTLAYRDSGRPTYALEGSVFISGAAIQWLRDGLGLIPSAEASERLARSIQGTGGVYFVPAFIGLGTPYWDPRARGALVGLTRATGVAEIVRAALEAVCFQMRDLIEAMAADGARPRSLRVDGGMVANDWMLQFLADILDLPVERSHQAETTLRGAAALAAVGAGILPSLAAVGDVWRAERRFTPAMDPATRASLYEGWRQAVARTLSPQAGLGAPG